MVERASYWIVLATASAFWFVRCVTLFQNDLTSVLLQQREADDDGEDDGTGVVAIIPLLPQLLRFSETASYACIVGAAVALGNQLLVRGYNVDGMSGIDVEYCRLLLSS